MNTSIQVQGRGRNNMAGLDSVGGRLRHVREQRGLSLEDSPSVRGSRRASCGRSRTTDPASAGNGCCGSRMFLALPWTTCFAACLRRGRKSRTRSRSLANSVSWPKSATSHMGRRSPCWKSTGRSSPGDAAPAAPTCPSRIGSACTMALHRSWRTDRDWYG